MPFIKSIITTTSLLIAFSFSFPSTFAQSEIVNEENNFKMRLVPALYLNFSKSSKIINLTKYNGQSNDRLVYGDYQSGFHVSKYHYCEAGLGAAIKFFYDNPTGLNPNIWADIGLIPIKGSRYASESTILNLQELNIVQRNIPLKTAEFKKWKNWDSVTFTSSGSILFFGEIRLGIGSFGSAKIAQGRYQTFVQKMDEANILVRITKEHLNTLSVQAGATILSLSTSNFEEISNGISYKINISSELGKMAYQDLIKGNVLAIENLLLQKVDYVEKWDSSTTNQIGHYKTSFYGLPIFLNTTINEGTTYEIDNSEFFYKNTRTKTYYSIFTKEKQANFFNKYSEHFMQFYGASYKVIDDKKQFKTTGRFGQFLWSSATNASTKNKLDNVIKDLIKTTGIREAFKVYLPDEKNLGYVDVDLSLTLNDQQTKNMIYNLDFYRTNKISDLAIQKAKIYFKKTFDIDGICTNSQSLSNRNNIPYKSCQEQKLAETLIGAELMAKKLKLMKENWNDDKAFVKNYSDFGKIMLKNQFLFQTAIELAGPLVVFNYSIQGKNISHYQVNFQTTDKLGILIKRNGVFEDSIQKNGIPDNGIIIVPSNPGVDLPI